MLCHWHTSGLKWYTLEDSNLHTEARLENQNLSSSATNLICTSSLASNVLRGAFLNDIEDIRTPRLKWSSGVVTLHLSPKTAALQAAAISYLPPDDMLGHSDWIRTSIPRIRSQSLESDQVLLNGVKAINYFDKSALLNP